MECVSAALRHNFREFCSTLSLRLIDDMFTGCGIRPGEVDPELLQNVSGARRGRVEEYHASLDWTNPVDAQMFLSVISFALTVMRFPCPPMGRETLLQGLMASH
jgi:hypothetical protein